MALFRSYYIIYLLFCLAGLCLSQPGGRWIVSTRHLSADCSLANSTDVDAYYAGPDSCFPTGSSGIGGDTVYSPYRCNDTHALFYTCSDIACNTCDLLEAHELNTCVFSNPYYTRWTCPTFENGFMRTLVPPLGAMIGVTVVQSFDLENGPNATVACSNSTARTHRIGIDAVCAPQGLTSQLQTCNGTHEITWSCASADCRSNCTPINVNPYFDSCYQTSTWDRVSCYLPLPPPVQQPENAPVANPLATPLATPLGASAPISSTPSPSVTPTQNVAAPQSSPSPVRPKSPNVNSTSINSLQGAIWTIVSVSLLFCAVWLQ